MPDQQGDLSEAFITQQRTRLEAMRRELLGGEENTIADERTSQEKHDDEAVEFEDDAQNMAQDEINQSLRNVNEHRIGDILRALQKTAKAPMASRTKVAIPSPRPGSRQCRKPSTPLRSRGAVRPGKRHRVLDGASLVY